jgi:beta-aspartyl-peptidase (threonine type)
MIVVASANGSVGIKEAMHILKTGGSAVDAVEAGIRAVEANPDDHTVGYGGYPNLLGEVELDAGLMDGRDLTSGAVAAIHGYKHPISIARQVMETLPHVLLVGAGAERFAAERGFEREPLLTEAARQVWERRLQQAIPDIDLARLGEQPDLARWVRIATDPERAGGTVNFIAQDGQGDLCVGVSTSGWAWKYPGRVGDSPLVGAGLYADNRYGAAACTGMGEMAIRAGTARSIMLYLKQGATLAEAGAAAMTDLSDLGGRFLSQMHFIIVDPAGGHAAFSNVEGRSYIYMTDAMEEPVERERVTIPTEKRWEA